MHINRAAVTRDLDRACFPCGIMVLPSLEACKRMLERVLGSLVPFDYFKEVAEIVGPPQRRFRSSVKLNLVILQLAGRKEGGIA